MSSIKKSLAIIAASLLAAFALSAVSAMPSPAFAANTNGNVAYVNEGNLENMTIVGEGNDNHVVVTNTAASAPSPTGFVMANLPLFIIGLVIACIAAALIVRSRHSAAKASIKASKASKSTKSRK